MVAGLAAADWLRIANAVLAVVLAVGCSTCVVLAPTWDQRRRFVVLLGYGLITVGGQVQALGRPLSWTTVLLTAVTLAAALECGLFGWRRTRAVLATGRRPA